MIVGMCGMKGGSSKTTLAVLIAAEVAARGKKVLLLDADPQQTATGWCREAAAIGQPFPTHFATNENMHLPGQIDRLATGFDLVMVDTAPSLNAVQRAAMMAADLVLLPCGPSKFDLDALGRTVALVREAQQVRPHLRAAVVLTRLQPGTVMAKQARTAAEPAGLPVLRTEIFFRAAYVEAVSGGYGLGAYAPKDQAYAEIKALCSELRTLLGKPKGGPHAATQALA